MKAVEIRSSSIMIPALLVAFAACETDPTGSDTEPSQLFVAFASLANTPVAAGTGSPVIDCPAGGHMVVEGEHTRQSDRDVSIVTWDRSTTYKNCALARPGGVAVANGQMQNVGEVRFGQPVDQHAPILYHVSSQVGAMTTTLNGVSQTCEYDLGSVFEPDTNRYRITGTVCGRELTLTTPATP